MESVPCPLCNQSLSDGQATVQLREKGSQGINAASKSRGDSVSTAPGQCVHVQCRRLYCNPRAIIQSDKRKRDVTEETSRTLRSPSSHFDFSEHCLFCGTSAIQRGVEVFPVRTLEFQKSVEKSCNEREDDWAGAVRARLESVHDLPAADALYHQACSVNFRTGKNIPRSISAQNTKKLKENIGRPENSRATTAFLEVAMYLEQNDDEQVTITELVERMKDTCNEDAYSAVYMKKKLEEHFGDSIIFTEVNGKPNVVTFKNTASSILQTFYQRPKHQDPHSEKISVIETAAKLLRNDIRSIDTHKTTYPLPADISSLATNLEYVPESLKHLLRSLFAEKNADVKIASVGQAIIQATRPRVVIAPLQIGLGVQMHHHFSSKFLVDTLNSLGFSSSYSEVQKFESSAAASQSTDIPVSTPTSVLQFVADNVDHNLRTLDGHNTFHGMGIIAGITPGTQVRKPVTRISVTTADLTALGKIDINFFKPQGNALSSLVFSMLPDIRAADKTTKLDMLAKVSWPLRCPTPGWSGMMQMVQKGKYPGKSSVVFLPMIDMNASDNTCINSTLCYVSAEARKYGSTPVLTFDQPLYWKALAIILDESSDSDVRSVVLKLGGFHLEMSFLGCIGHLMAGSGLRELLETVYAPNAVGHMLTGKAVSRAVRGHFLVDSALHAILVSKTFDLPLVAGSGLEDNITSAQHSLVDDDACQESQPISHCSGTDDGFQSRVATTLEQGTPDIGVIANYGSNPDLQEVADLYDLLISGEETIERVCETQAIGRIADELTAHKQSLMSSRTSKLWLQYMDMVELLRSFIKAERTGDWYLHLNTTQQMLPYFAAAGHNLYLKSAYIYIQTMLNLRDEHPEVFRLFENGHHVLRRSDRYWAGLSSDLVIEQVLMRSVKTSGGMTRGRGMTESERTQWLFSMPACADINLAMQSLTTVGFQTSDQHKESTEASKNRDFKDTCSFLSFLIERNPFSQDKSLRNIETGVTAEKTVDVDCSQEVGRKAVQTMIGQSVSNYSFKRSQMAVTLDTRSTVTVDGEPVHVDPQLLFQRLTAVANGVSEDMSEIFSYELCSHPSSLFEPSGLLREPQKSVLADAIWSMGDCAATELPTDAQYVLDGGSLLHRIPWTRGSTFSAIIRTYVNYVQRNYVGPIIVFDGYTAGPSTKDMTHLRRTRGLVGPQVNFTENMPFKSKKESFLANKHNKQRFIDMLSGRLEESGCTVVNADGDADLRLVQTTLQYARHQPTVLIGEDTDLLVLLCHHTDLTVNNVIFKSERKQNLSRKMRMWDIQKTTLLLGPSICRLLPFAHAITGCDTTSRLFGIGKGVALKKMKMDESFREYGEVFNRKATREEVLKAGEAAIVCLYSGVSYESLELLRFRRFVNKVVSRSNAVQVNTLPPTSAAAMYHSLRVYLQVQQWIGEGGDLTQENWGWYIAKGELMPVKTHLPPAPERLLKIVRCACKTNCDTRRCTCRKHGLDCSMGCGECRGISCTNSSTAPENDLGEDADST